MVKLRLVRMGKKKQPTYRLVASDQRSPRDGRFIEIVGIYDPRKEPSAVTIDNEKAVGWLRQGAQPTDRARRLLEISGAWAQYKGAGAAAGAAGSAPVAGSGS
jgi:small subunit ribosomal protein S16